MFGIVLVPRHTYEKLISLPLLDVLCYSSLLLSEDGAQTAGLPGPPSAIQMLLLHRRQAATQPSSPPSGIHAARPGPAEGTGHRPQLPLWLQPLPGTRTPCRTSARHPRAAPQPAPAGRVARAHHQAAVRRVRAGGPVDAAGGQTRPAAEPSRACSALAAASPKNCHTPRPLARSLVP